MDYPEGERVRQQKECGISINFKSESQASVEMIENNAKELLEILGKVPSVSRGVFAVDQIGGAIAILQELISVRAQDRKRLAFAEMDEKAGERFEVEISLRGPFRWSSYWRNRLRRKNPSHGVFRWFPYRQSESNG